MRCPCNRLIRSMSWTARKSCSSSSSGPKKLLAYKPTSQQITNTTTAASSTTAVTTTSSNTTTTATISHTDSDEHKVSKLQGAKVVWAMHDGFYLGGHAQGKRKAFKDLAKAQAAAIKLPDQCGGVTLFNGYWELRANQNLEKSPSDEVSWTWSLS